MIGGEEEILQTSEEPGIIQILRKVVSEAWYLYVWNPFLRLARLIVQRTALLDVDEPSSIFKLSLPRRVLLSITRAEVQRKPSSASAESTLCNRDRRDINNSLERTA